MHSVARALFLSRQSGIQSIVQRWLEADSKSYSRAMTAGELLGVESEWQVMTDALKTCSQRAHLTFQKIPRNERHETSILVTIILCGLKCTTSKGRNNFNSGKMSHLHFEESNGMDHHEVREQNTIIWKSYFHKQTVPKNLQKNLQFLSLLQNF